MVTYEKLDKRLSQQEENMDSWSLINHLSRVGSGDGTLVENLRQNISLLREAPGSGFQDLDTRNRIRALNESNSHLKKDEVYKKLDQAVQSWFSFPDPCTPYELDIKKKMDQRTMTESEYDYLKNGGHPGFYHFKK